MAVKTPAQGTGVLLITANVGSLFEDPENLQKNWLREFYQVGMFVRELEISSHVECYNIH